MKQIPLLQGKALLVELPEGATNPIVDDYLLGYNLPPPEWAAGWGDESYDTINLPPGNWRIIGMLSEVTEEQARQIARHRKHNTIRDGKLAERLMFYNHTTNIYGQATALESLESAILAENWYFENPYGEEPTHLEHMRAGWLDNPITGDVRRVWNWKEAQSRVLCRERCLLLGREGL